MTAQGKTGTSLIGRIGSYLQIVAKDPSSTAFVPLAEAYRQTGLLDDALEVARIGTTRLPHFSPGFATMGRILGQMGRIDEAMGSYARALSIDRQSQAALVGLARLHLIRDERDQARKILSQAQAFHPDDEKIADMLIALDLPRPWAKIKQAAMTPPPVSTPEETSPEIDGEPIPTVTLAEIYVKQGLTAKALKVFREILRINPGNAVALERISQLQGLSAEPAAAADAPVPAGQHEVVGETQPLDAGVVQEQGQKPEPLKEQKHLSPLAALERWLYVIRQGRANV